jgi:hypothetical protein
MRQNNKGSLSFSSIELAVIRPVPTPATYDPGGRPTSPMPGRLKLLHPEVERAPVGAEG